MRLTILFTLLLTFTSWAGDLTHIDEIIKGKLIHGKKQTADTLKGKVILFEYWGFN